MNDFSVCSCDFVEKFGFYLKYLIQKLGLVDLQQEGMIKITKYNEESRS